MTRWRMKINSLVRSLVNLPLTVKGKSIVLCVPESTLKKTVRTNNTVSLRVSKTSERILQGLPTLSQWVATTTEGTIMGGATTATTTTLRTTLDTAKAAMTKTDRRTTTVTKAFPKLTKPLNTSLGDKTLRSTLRCHQEGTRTRGEATTGFQMDTTTDKTWTSDTRVGRTTTRSRATTRGSKNTHAM